MKSVYEFGGIFLYKDAVDMRKSINGLSVLAQEAGIGSLMGPNLFIFTGRRRDVVKILYYDKCGFCLWMKLLERDKFPWPKRILESVISISSRELEMLLEGWNIWKLKPFKKIFFERVS